MLDKDSPVPLYYQIQTIIEEHIDSGEWKPGMQVPSERQLCDHFQVSRITVRQALEALANQGRLLRRQGRGTFVASPRIEQKLSRLTGFTQDMESRGHDPGARVLRLEAVPAPAPAARALDLEVGAPIILLKRLRLSDGEPMALESAHLPQSCCPDLVEEKLENQSLYALLARKYEVIPTRAEQQIEALGCPPAEAKLLGVHGGAPILHMYRVTFDGDGQPFEYTESFYRGDRYTFHVELFNGASEHRRQPISTW